MFRGFYGSWGEGFHHGHVVYMPQVEVSNLQLEGVTGALMYLEMTIVICWSTRPTYLGKHGQGM